MSDGVKSYVGGGEGDDDLRANYADQDGTVFSSGSGNDTLRGGNYDDVMTGGAGNDQMFGGLGADEFRFFGGQAKARDVIEGDSDTDFLRDLNFGQLDRIVLGGFGDGKFTKTATVQAFDNGNDVIIDSYQDLADLAQAGSLTLTALSNGNLLVGISNATGQLQVISINGGVAAYNAAVDTDL
jgi:Ca2+-binding RTX toxin-like protein